MRSEGHQLVGVRLDSGDMVAQSRTIRAFFDAAGFPELKIFASSGFDEYAIAEALKRGAEIESFGVGTNAGVDVNTLGGAVLLDLLANTKHQVRKVLVASSMSIYGEGKYICSEHGAVYPQLRPEAQLQTRDWELRCPTSGRHVAPAPTDDRPYLERRWHEPGETRATRGDEVRATLAAMHERPAAKRDLPVDDPKVRQPDISLARKLFGWEPKVSFEEGIRKTLAYFREAPEVKQNRP